MGHPSASARPDRNRSGRERAPVREAPAGAVARPHPAFWLVLVALVTAVVLAAAAIGGDATWDFRNYHLYNPFALLNKPFGVDIAPAHHQTFFSPTLDLIYYGLARSIGSVPVLNAAWALGHAAAVALAFVLTCRLLRPATTAEYVALGLFTAIAATGVAGGSTLATTGSEALPALLVLLAVLVIVPRDLDSLPSLLRVFSAGLLVGLGCGLKLTLSYATLAFALALIAIPRRHFAEIVTRPVSFVAGVGAGAAALSGYWWLHLWTHYGNPLFPFFNDVFRSPMAVPDRWIDRTFLPHSVWEALKAPWSWAVHLSWATSESRLRDPRFAIALPAALLVLVGAVLRRPHWRPWPSVFVALLFFLAFWTWRIEFSIYRYLATIELLTGTMMALVALPLLRRLPSAWLLPAAPAALLAGLAAVTVYPHVNRTQPGGTPLQVDLGPLPPDSMVLILDNEPMAYLAAFADPRIRFIGTNDFFMSLDGSNPMQPLVAEAIAHQQGPLWGLDSPPEQKDRGEQTLRHYGLTRGECRPVRSNVSPLAIRLCRLHHAPGAPS